MKSYTPEIDRPAPEAVSMRAAVVGPIAANIAFVMELTLVPLLLPAIQLQYNLSIGDLAWVFNSYGIAVAIGVLLGGLCGDAFDTRKVFGYGVALFAMGSLFVAAAESFGTLLVARAIQGLGAGIFSPLFPILLTQASPMKPGRMLIFWGSISGYAVALVPLLYGGFLDEQGWNIAFIFIASLAIIALVVLKGSQVPDDRPVVSRRTSYSELFRARHLWLTFVYVFCTYGAITYYLFRLPIWLSNNDVETVSVGFALTVMWLTFSGVSTLLRNMVDSHHIRTIMLAAPFLIIGGVSLSYDNENFLFLILSSVLVGSGLACSNAPSTQMILRFAPRGLSAFSTSLDITFARLGGIAMVAILAETEFRYAAFAIGCWCFLAAYCALMISKDLSNPI